MDTLRKLRKNTQSLSWKKIVRYSLQWNWLTYQSLYFSHEKHAKNIMFVEAILIWLEIQLKLMKLPWQLIWVIANARHCKSHSQPKGKLALVKNKLHGKMTKANAQRIGKATIKAIRTIMKRTCSNKDVKFAPWYINHHNQNDQKLSSISTKVRGGNSNFFTIHKILLVRTNQYPYNLKLNQLKKYTPLPNILSIYLGCTSLDRYK